MKYMKILQVSEIYPPSLGGVPTFVESLSHRIAKRGHTVTVITTSPTTIFKSTASYEKDNVLVFRSPAIKSPINPTNNWMTLLPFISATRIFFKVRPDIVHMHTPVAGLHRIIMFWARLFKTPVVLTNHVMPENLILNTNMSNFWERITRHMIWSDIIRYTHKSEYVTAPTETAVDMLRHDSVRTPAMAITNGVDEVKFSPGPKNDRLLLKLGVPLRSWPKLIYIGRLDGEKRIDILLNSMPHILKRYPNAHLTLVGRGLLLEDLKRLANDLGINEHITFTGALPESQKPDILRSSDLFVIASPAELQCISGLEALASGIPIVASDVAALVEMCQDGKNGFQFHYPNEKSLAYAVDKIFSSRGGSKRLGANGRRWVLKHHTDDISASLYENIYVQALNS